MPRDVDTSAHEERGSSWQELVTRIAIGDESALRAFYDETRSLVYGVVLRIVSLPAVAEEVAMDVYLQVWRQASRYQQGRGSVFTWLMLLARSRALDRLRRDKADTAYAWENFADGFDMVDSGHGPERLAQARQTQARMYQTLLELPDGQRQVIELSFYEGMSHIEIAEQLQLPLGTVKSRIRSAIVKFRQAVI
jgi:RNA polymerase sigma-70 factor (ECF subfamily)